MKRMAFFFILWLIAVSAIFISQAANAEVRKGIGNGDVNAFPDYQPKRKSSRENAPSQISTDEELPQYLLELQKEPSRQKRSKRVARDYSSYEESSARMRSRVRRQVREDKELEFRLGGLGGISRNDNNSENHYSFAFLADFRETYFGMELDAFFGGRPTRVTNETTNTRETSQLYGGMFNLNGHIPFHTGPIKWVPKLGVGYGLLVSKTNTESDTETSTSQNQFNGPYGIVGLEIEPFPFLLIATDYARTLSTLGTNGKLESETAPGTLGDVQFDRFRLGLYFRVVSHFIVGGQYQRRATSFTLSPDTGDSSSESSAEQHFLGLLMFEL